MASQDTQQLPEQGTVATGGIPLWKGQGLPSFLFGVYITDLGLT